MFFWKSVGREQAREGGRDRWKRERRRKGLSQSGSLWVNLGQSWSIRLSLAFPQVYSDSADLLSKW